MRIAAIVHVFYPELWPELAECLTSLASVNPQPAIFVTIPPDAPDALVDGIRTAFPDADIKRLENRGFDVGPFVEVLARLDLSRFDLVLKLHTKRNRFGIVNYLPLFGGQWRRRLLAFCSSPKAAARSISLFENDPSVGMVGTDSLIVRDEPDRAPFVGGTMFFARASLMSEVTRSVSFADFSPTTRSQTASLAHEWERRLGEAIASQGHRLVGYPRASLLFRATFPLRRALYNLLRFIAARR